MTNKSILRAGFFAVLILITVLSALSSSAESECIEGLWMGTLKVSVAELRIVFKISANPDGSLTATMDSPDQRAENIPVNKITFENGRLYLESKVVQGTYDGQIKEDGSIEGKRQQSGFSIPLVLKHVEEAPKLHRPQEPKKPYPYVEGKVVLGELLIEVRSQVRTLSSVEGLRQMIGFPFTILRTLGVKKNGGEKNNDQKTLE